MKTTSLILSAAQHKQLLRLIAYLFDDEQEHAFNCEGHERTHIYWQAVRPLALRAGYRSQAALRREESQWQPLTPRRAPKHTSIRNR